MHQDAETINADLAKLIDTLDATAAVLHTLASCLLESATALRQVTGAHVSANLAERVRSSAQDPQN